MLEDGINRMYSGAQPSSARVAWLNEQTNFSEDFGVVVESGNVQPGGEPLDGDPRLAEMLTLAGALDIARAGWLCRIGPDGSLSELMASVGSAPGIEIAHVLQSFSGLINLSNADQPFQWLAAGREYLVCDIGHDGDGRVVLVLRSRMLRAADWSTIKVAARRLQRLVQLSLSLGASAARRRKEQAADVAAQSLSDLCPFGVLVIDVEQRIFLANQAVKALFERSGLITSSADKLAISDADNAVRFQVALRTVLSARAGEGVHRTVALLDDTASPLLLRIARLPGDEPRACVIVTNPTAGSTVDVQPLAQVFALTPVETRLVKELVLGHNVQEAAQVLHLKVETARTYLKQIFQKTNTHRQLELVQLMQNGALPSVASA